MRRLLLLLGLGAAGCFPRGWSPESTPALALEERFPFLVGPYLVPLAQGAVAVVLEHPLGSAPLVEWGAEGEPAVTRVEARAQDGLWVARLEGLPLDRPLRYTVLAENAVVGPLSFRSGRRRGESFRFAAFGDTRTGHLIHREVALAVAREPVDFVIHSGDMVETGGDEREWRLFFQIEASLLAERPIFGAVGNHDDNPRGDFRRRFLSAERPHGQRYFASDWGDVRVVVLDSEVELRAGSSQYAYVEAALAEGAAAGQLLVLVLHYPPYSSGAHGSNLEVRQLLAELAPRFGVELVLAGHDHDYERTHPIDGTTYMVAASAGATIRRVSPSAFTASLRTEPHFVLFDVERGGLVGRTVNLAGDSFDSFTIPPNPSRAPPR